MILWMTVKEVVLSPHLLYVAPCWHTSGTLLVALHMVQITFLLVINVLLTVENTQKSVVQRVDNYLFVTSGVKQNVKLIKIISVCVLKFTQILTNGLGQLICGSHFPSALCSSLLDPPPCPPAHLTVVQNSEPLHNFLPTLKLSLCHFGAKSLVVMDLLIQSISQIDQSLAPCWPLHLCPQFPEFTLAV